MNHKYDDMLRMPHHVSKTRPQMPVADRAAQFKPFAALTGYEAALRETARLTDRRMELDETEKAVLDLKLRLLSELLPDQPEISVTYFQPDDRKEGGAYLTACGVPKKIDEYAHILMMMDGTKIPIDEVLEIRCDGFKAFGME